MCTCAFASSRNNGLLFSKVVYLGCLLFVGETPSEVVAFSSMHSSEWYIYQNGFYLTKQHFIFFRPLFTYFECYLLNEL